MNIVLLYHFFNIIKKNLIINKYYKIYITIYIILILDINFISLIIYYDLILLF